MRIVGYLSGLIKPRIIEILAEKDSGGAGPTRGQCEAGPLCNGERCTLVY